MILPVAEMCPDKKDFKFCSEAVPQRFSVKMVFLEISQNSREGTCARASFLIKLKSSVLSFIEKRDSGTSVFL